MSLEGSVALITGAARGQGRSHALALAALGAVVIGVDRCAPMDSVPYPLASRQDLDETVAMVAAAGGTMRAAVADVRSLEQLEAAVAPALSELGRLDVVVANAGIAPVGGAAGVASSTVWRDVIDVNLTGAWHTALVGIPHLIAGGRGGSIVFTSSVAGLAGIGSWQSAGGPAYSASKHALVGLMRALARDLAPHRIRVNTLHPTGVATPMVLNDAMAAFLSGPAASANPLRNALPVEMVEPADVSNALAWLVSDAARYVTGVTLPVDAGYLVR